VRIASLGDAASTKWCRFSDLVGSTALSARMDPEDLREVISASQKRVAKTVQRFDGFVARYMGDGVLSVGSRLCACKPDIAHRDRTAWLGM
jgi:class 3 adenylate cyclase